MTLREQVPGLDTIPASTRPSPESCTCECRYGASRPAPVHQLNQDGYVTVELGQSALVSEEICPQNSILPARYLGMKTVQDMGLDWKYEHGGGDYQLVIPMAIVVIFLWCLFIISILVAR